MWNAIMCDYVLIIIISGATKINNSIMYLICEYRIGDHLMGSTFALLDVSPVLLLIWMLFS